MANHGGLFSFGVGLGYVVFSSENPSVLSFQLHTPPQTQICRSTEIQRGKTMVEETEKSAVATVNDELENLSLMDKNHHGDDSETEEGEIVAGDSDAATAMAPPPRHPLEHSWTFWFDNPSAKSKQAAWGSSIRPIYTFSTVEDFWRYIAISFYFGLIALYILHCGDCGS